MSLRTLFRRSPWPLAARLSDSVVLGVGRWAHVRSEGLTAAGRAGRFRVSIHSLPGDDLGRARIVKLGELLDELIPRLDRDGRDELFRFAFEALKPELEQADGLSVAYSLRTLRDRLGEEMPTLVADPASPHVAVVDFVVSVDDRSFWVFGWASDADEPESRFELVSPEGHRVPLLPGASRFDRRDAAESLAAAGVPSPTKNGYVKYFELDTPSLVQDGWRAELTSADGATFEADAPRVTRDPRRAQDMMLWQFEVDRPELEDIRLGHALPALERLQRRYASSVEVATEVEHGPVPDAPEVSVVVPLYNRIDLIEHQLAQFWRDPDLSAAELIYVLDSPEQAEELNRLASELHELFGLPFKILTLNRNGGYATANNLGASRARGRLLLLLNSDVLPVSPGWLGRMRAFYDATPEIGALGPKLLYEDESIQHAGMYFKRDPVTRLWENQHYFKGFNRSLAPANISRPVPAVTGACMMVERALWESLGGLDNVYVQGGYEDSDFCVRLVEAGRRNWYVADVELYHLEAQSFFIHARLANPCNAWIQTHRWDERITALMEDRPHVAQSRLVAVT